MKQSKELTNFYRAYLNWLNAGAPIANEYDFKRTHGICCCITEFIEVEYAHKQENDHRKIISKMIDEIQSQFLLAGLEKWLPFNKFGDVDGIDYLYEVLNGTCHLNPKRIQWVKGHAGEQA